MLSFFLHAQDAGKYVAWLVVLIVLFVAVYFLKDAVGTVLMKLYEYFIQKNS